MIISFPEARKNLSSKDMLLRRQSALSNIELKTIHSTLQKYQTREERSQMAEERRNMRSLLDRKQLEDEIEKMEAEMEMRLHDMIESHKAEIESLTTKWEGECAAIKTQCNNDMAEQVLHQTESYNETLQHFEHALALLEGQAVKAASVNSSLQEQIASSKEELSSLSDETVCLRNENQDLKDRLEQKSREAACAIVELAEAKSRYEESTAQQSADAEVAQKAYLAEIDQLKSTNSKYAVQLKRNAAELSRRISQYASMQARLDNTTHKLLYLEQQEQDKDQEYGAEKETKQQIFRTLKEENRSLTDSLTLASDEIHRLRDEEYLHTCVISDMTREIQQLLHQRSDWQNNVQELQQSIQGLHEELQDRDKGLTSAENHIQQIQEDLVRSEQQLTIKDEEMRKMQMELNSSLHKRNLAEQRASTAESTQEQLTIALSTTRSQLAAVQVELAEAGVTSTALREERNSLRALQQETLQHTDSLFEALTAEEQLSARLKDELEKQMTLSQRLEKELEVASGEMVRLQVECADADQLRQRLTSAADEVKSLTATLQRIQDDHNAVLARESQLHEDAISQAARETAEWKAKADSEAAAAALQTKQMMALNMAAADQIRALQSRNEALEDQLQQMQNQLIVNNSSYAEQMTVFEQENEQLLDQIHAVKEQNAQLAETNAALTAESQSLQSRLQTMFEELADMQQRQTEEVTRWLAMVAGKDAEIAEITEKCSQQVTANSNLKAQFERSQQMLSQSQEENQSLLNSMDALRSAEKIAADIHSTERAALARQLEAATTQYTSKVFVSIG